MEKIGLFWLRDDFRVSKTADSIEPLETDQVVVFYLYKENIFKNHRLRNGGLVSLLKILKRLIKININLEIIQTESFSHFFDKLLKKNNFSLYWNKVYEQITLNLIIICQKI